MIRVALVLLALAAPAAAQPAPVRVVITVDGLSANRGQVLLGLCTKTQFLSAKCAFQAVVPVGAGRSVQAVAMVPPGQYAAQVVYDLNRNFKMDANMIGIPLEPTGFSRNAIGQQAAPRFADAALTINRASALTVSVR
jgi:uncharacterized protein (DUF2141 family)